MLTSSLIQHLLKLLKTLSSSFQVLWFMLLTLVLPLDHLTSVRYGLINFSKNSFIKETLKNLKVLKSLFFVIEILPKLLEVKLGSFSLWSCLFSNNFQRFVQTLKNYKSKMLLVTWIVSKRKLNLCNKSKKPSQRKRVSE